MHIHTVEGASKAMFVTHSGIYLMTYNIHLIINAAFTCNIHSVTKRTDVLHICNNDMNAKMYPAFSNFTFDSQLLIRIVQIVVGAPRFNVTYRFRYILIDM